MVLKALLPLGLTLCLVQPLLAQELAPLFSGFDLTAERFISLEDYRGKVVLLDFWASWCPPCLVSLPAYDRLREELDTEMFEVISINVDENTEDGMKFLGDHPVAFPVLADPEGNIGILYGIRTLPRSFILDRNGQITATFKSFKEGDEIMLKQKISELLARRSSVKMTPSVPRQR